MSLLIQSSNPGIDAIYDGLYLIGSGLRFFKEDGVTNEEIKQHIRDIVAALQLFIGDIDDAV